MSPEPSQTRTRLAEAGFEYLTVWKLKANQCKPESTAWDTSSGWIYAFEAEDKIQYIGIATTVLRSRFDGYSYQLNDTVGTNIRKLLLNRIEVRIYGIRRLGLSKAELELQERKLIMLLNPLWNVRR